jgi:hypothetical protein
MRWRLHVSYVIVIRSENWIFWKDFRKILKRHENSSSGSRVLFERTDRRTDRHDETVNGFSQILRTRQQQNEGNDRCLFCRPYRRQMHSVGRTVEFLKDKLKVHTVTVIRGTFRMIASLASMIRCEEETKHVLFESWNFLRCMIWRFHFVSDNYFLPSLICLQTAIIISVLCSPQTA